VSKLILLGDLHIWSLEMWLQKKCSDAFLCACMSSCYSCAPNCFLNHGNKKLFLYSGLLNFLLKN